MIGNLSGLGVAVPGGFATTSAAYRDFLKESGLADRIDGVLKSLDVDDIEALTDAGKSIRDWIAETPLPDRLKEDLSTSWQQMSNGEDIAVAVRSSATAEDLPDASFAGQQETFLNVRGIDNLIEAVHQVFASLYNDRAIPCRLGCNTWFEAILDLQASCSRWIPNPVTATPCL
jgi:pyruvate,water dikinase